MSVDYINDAVDEATNPQTGIRSAADTRSGLVFSTMEVTSLALRLPLTNNVEVLDGELFACKTISVGPYFVSRQATVADANVGGTMWPGRARIPTTTHPSKEGT